MSKFGHEQINDGNFGLNFMLSNIGRVEAVEMAQQPTPPPLLNPNFRSRPVNTARKIIEQGMKDRSSFIENVQSQTQGGE